MENIDNSNQINIESLNNISDENALKEIQDKTPKLFPNSIESNIKFVKSEIIMAKNNGKNKSTANNSCSNSSSSSSTGSNNQKENVLPKSLIKTPQRIRAKLTPEMFQYETPKMAQPYYRKFKEHLLMAPKCNRQLRRYSTNPNNIILENGDDQMLRVNRPNSLCRILFNSPEVPVTGDSPQQ